MAENIDTQFLDAVGGLVAPEPSLPLPDLGLTGERCLELFDSQLGSRHLDLAARQLGSAGIGYYTIGSSGHEGNAALAAALRPTDPALLHYRSGGVYCARARQGAGIDPVRDILLGAAASADRPLAGRRSKGARRAEPALLPETPANASHRP